jgi:hypothetical protein
LATIIAKRFLRWTDDHDHGRKRRVPKSSLLPVLI